MQTKSNETGQRLHTAGDPAARQDAGCAEFQSLKRREILNAARSAWGAMRAPAAVGAASTVTSRAAFARGGSTSRDVVVFVMLRGGMDGLSLCVPHGDPDYATMRGNLAVPPPGSIDGALDLDGFFGLNPAAQALLPVYQTGDLAFVNTAGSPNPSRSHFDAMKFIEGGFPDAGASILSDGWLGRHIAGTTAAQASATMRGLAIDWTSPQTLAGGPKTLTIADPSSFDFGGWWNTKEERRAMIRAMYDVRPEPLRSAALDSLATIDVLGAIDFDGYAPSNGAAYPDGELGARFERAAAIIKADIGVEAIEIDRGAWDHHDNLGPINGQFAAMIGELSETLAAFHADLGALNSSVTVVCLSEFGRRVDPNGSNGVDHGRGGCMLLMGGNVNGGQVVRDWVGLDPMNLDDLALPVQIDYRDVLIEVLRDRAGNANAASIFPGHTWNDWGLLRS